MAVDLSVVVATTEASRSIEECLRRLSVACHSFRTEIIVVDASVDDTATRASACGVPITLIRHDSGTLTPQLWAAGLRRSSGRHVAFTTGHCLASRDWAAHLTTALREGAAGAGGSLVISPGTRCLDHAIFFLRYSAFMPTTMRVGRTAGEIAGDNAMYKREWLDRHADTLADGFWEIDFHRLIRRNGAWLAAVPEATMGFGLSFPLRTIARHRFAHGVEYGAGRVQGGRRAAWLTVAASPCIPFLLASRAFLRLRFGADRLRFGAALPWFLVLASAWAAGEAWGAIHGSGLHPVVDRPAHTESGAGSC